MPVAPKYQDQVTEQAYPQARVNMDAPIEAFGGGRGLNNVVKAAQGVLGDVEQVALREQQRADDVATMQAYSDLIRAKNQLQFNEKDGLITKRGRAVFDEDVVSTFGARFKEEADRLSESLTNKSQQQMFARMAMKEEDSFNGHLQDHVARERVNYEDQALKGFVEASAQDVRANAYDAKLVYDRNNLVGSAMFEHFKKRGVDPNTANVAIQNQISKNNLGVIETMVTDKNYYKAKSFTDQAAKAGWLTKDDEATAKKWLETEGTKVQAQAFSDKLILKGYSEAEGLAKIRDISDPDMRAQARNNWVQYNRDVEAAKEHDYQRNAEAAYATFSKSGDLDSISAPVWDSMRAQDQQSLKKLAKSQRDGQIIETEPAAYQAILQKLNDPKTRADAIKDFQNNQITLRTVLNDRDFAEISDHVDGLAKENERALDKAQAFLQKDEIVRSTLREAGLYDKKNKPKDVEVFSQYSYKMDKLIEGYRKRTGNYPGETELRAMVDGLVADVDVKGSVFDKKVFELAADKAAIITKISDVPRNVQRSLRVTLPDATDQEIIQAYDQFVKGVQSGP